MFHSSPPLSSSNRPTPRTPKIRLSCDECAASKVKCDKTRPACDRCTGNGLTCVYSPSRKFGKPPSKKRFLAPQAPLRTASPTTSTKQHEHLNILSPEISFITNNPGDGDAFISAWADYGTGDRLSSIPELDNMFDFELTVSTTLDHSNMATSPLTHGNGGGRGQSDHDQISTQRNHVLSPLNLGDLNMPSPEAMLVEDYSCKDRAYATLVTLDCRAKHSFAARVGKSARESVLMSPFDEHPPSPPPIRPTMDKVLSVNKAALATVVELLDCPCAQDPHLAMLYASIIFKVLIWYEAVSGVPPSLNPVTPSSTAFNHSAATSFEACKSSSAQSNFQLNGIAPTPIQVGGHILDEDDQIMLQRDLLLREVRKVGRVIDLMAASNKELRSSDSEEGGAGSWYSFASNRLRDELQNMIKKIKNIKAPFRTAAT